MLLSLMKISACWCLQIIITMYNCAAQDRTATCYKTQAHHYTLKSKTALHEKKHLSFPTQKNVTSKPSADSYGDSPLRQQVHSYWLPAKWNNSNYQLLFFSVKKNVCGNPIARGGQIHCEKEWLFSKRVSSYINQKTLKVHEEMGSKYFPTHLMAHTWQSTGSNMT
jgi:hypothetical protein